MYIYIALLKAYTNQRYLILHASAAQMQWYNVEQLFAKNLLKVPTQ